MFDHEMQLEQIKLKKAHNNSISFSDIEKNNFRFMKDLSLPPIGHEGKALSVADSHATSTRNANQEVLDEIHNLRMKMIKKTDEMTGKVNSTKKDKDQFLLKYFMAKKQLQAINSTK